MVLNIYVLRTVNRDNKVHKRISVIVYFSVLINAGAKNVMLKTYVLWLVIKCSLTIPTKKLSAETVFTCLKNYALVCLFYSRKFIKQQSGESFLLTQVLLFDRSFFVQDECNATLYSSDTHFVEAKNTVACVLVFTKYNLAQK